MNKRTGIILCVVLVVLAVSVLLIAYSLPKSFAQIVNAPKDEFSSVVLGMSRPIFVSQTTGEEFLVPRVESYTLEQAEDSDHAEVFYEMLSSTKYRKSFRNLIPGMTDYVDSTGGGYSFVIIMSAGERHCQISILGDGKVSVGWHGETIEVMYQMTDPEILETMAAYVKQYGIKTGL